MTNETVNKKDTTPRKITREFLEQLGITEVTPDGRIFVGKKEMPHCLRGSKRKQYYAMNFRNPNKDIDGKYQIQLTVHRIVWAWFNGETPDAPLIIDHLDNNQFNNHITNLAVTTTELNTMKNSKARQVFDSEKEIKCSLKKPRSYYEGKLKIYEELVYLPENNDERKQYYTYMAYRYRAHLRYYDSHIDEETYQIQRDNKDLKMIKYLAQEAKKEANLTKWHQLNKIAKDWNTYDSDLKEQLIQVILKGHTFNE